MTGSPQTPEELMEFFGLAPDGTAPDLHEDLVPWVEDDGPFGPSLKHPLVYELLLAPIQHGRVNKHYEYKVEACKRALAESDYYTYVFLHERPYRFDAFTEIEDSLLDAEYWELLGQIWIDTENLWQNYDGWYDALTADRVDRHLLMDDDERHKLDTMGDDVPITIYRGQAEEHEVGLSWTLDRKRAKWFARRFAGHREDTPIVWVGTVWKSDIVAYFDGRSENEIVALPDHVTIVRAEDVE